MTPAPQSAAPGASQPASAPAAAQTIKIGIEGPFTGPNALTGEEMKNASSMAFDAINWTVGPYKIEPVYIDDQSDPAKGAAAYEQAVVSQKITAGILGWHSSVAVAQMEVTAKYKIPHFFAMGATGVVNQKFNSDKTKYGYWTSKGWPDPAKLTIGYVQAIEDFNRATELNPTYVRVLAQTSLLRVGVEEQQNPISPAKSVNLAIFGWHRARLLRMDANRHGVIAIGFWLAFPGPKNHVVGRQEIAWRN